MQPQLTIADLAEVRRLSLKTLRTSWRKRVLQGDIPAPVKGKGHPRWSAEAVNAFFSGNPPEEKAPNSPSANRRAMAAALSIRASMARNT